MENFNIEGPAAAVFTPVSEDGVNYELIASYLTFLLKKGIRSVVVGGTTGEGPCLNVNQRKRLAEAWLDAAGAERVQVIIQVGGAPLPDVLELAKHAEDNSADAILSLPEIYYKPKSAAELVSYLGLISKAAPSLPIIYYDFPGMSGVTVDVKEFVTLASASIPRFRGIKIDLESGLQVPPELRDRITVYIANHLLAPAVMLGFDSSVATVTNLFPRLVRVLIEAVKNGDLHKAKKLQETLVGLVADISNEGDWVPTMKYAMGLVTGIDMGPPLQPLAPLTDAQKSRIKAKIYPKLNHEEL